MPAYRDRPRRSGPRLAPERPNAWHPSTPPPLIYATGPVLDHEKPWSGGDEKTDGSGRRARRAWRQRCGQDRELVEGQPLNELPVLPAPLAPRPSGATRSEEHTSEL